MYGEKYVGTKLKLKQQFLSQAELYQNKQNLNKSLLWPHSLEEWYNFAGQFLSLPETLGVQHDLSNELSIWLRHGKGSEQLLQIVWQIWSTSIARVHGNKNGHVWIHSDLFANQFHLDRSISCNIQSDTYLKL